MRVACLQFDSVIGQVDDNIRKANSILAAASLQEPLDILVLPELAFTGYNFPSLEAIKPYLEPTAFGVSSKWAIATAQRLQCHVIVGYPEKSSETDDQGNSVNYNSTITIGPDGSVLATYRKSFLYYTDEVWASEGSGFFCGEVGSLGIISHGICMDINPYQFTAPYEAYEFANHSLKAKAPLVIVSTAWLTHASQQELADSPRVPDMSTVAYWHSRLAPLTTLAEAEEITVVFANRVGTEVNENRALVTKSGQVVDFGESVSYAGSSCVMRFTSEEAVIFDILGKAEEALLVVNTAQLAKYTMVRRSSGDEQEDV